MATVNENPVLALNRGDRFVQVLQYNKTAKRWEKKDRIDGGKPVQWFKMLNLADQSAVWVWADVEGSLGEIWTASRVIKLPAIAGIGLIVVLREYAFLIITLGYVFYGLFRHLRRSKRMAGCAGSYSRASMNRRSRRISDMGGNARSRFSW